MTTADPLIDRCLTLTGSFETGRLPPECYAILGVDFDGCGVSFSCLQWNFGKQTLQPLLAKMYEYSPDVMVRCFVSGKHVELAAILKQEKPAQMAWARSIQNATTKQVDKQWVDAFFALGHTKEWQGIARSAAEGIFDRAKFQASQLGLKSDRGVALCFDCGVQNGEVRPLAMHHVLDIALPEWGEAERMRAIAEAVAMGSDPRWRDDVLRRKQVIANGAGKVHGIVYDLAAQFGL